MIDWHQAWHRTYVAAEWLRNNDIARYNETGVMDWPELRRHTRIAAFAHRRELVAQMRTLRREAGRAA